MPDMPRIRARIRQRRALLALLLAGWLPAAMAVETLELAEAERLALERDQSILALGSRISEAQERAVADGALPDPELTFGSRNQPVDDLGASDEGMAMFTLGVRQRFPFGGTRSRVRERGRLEAAALRADRNRRALEVRRAVRRAWLDWRFAHESLALAREAEEEFESLVDLAQRRLAAGTARQRDVSQARLELAALSERIIELVRERDAAAAELERWVNEPVRVLRPGGAPDWPRPDPIALRERVAGHPTLVALRLRLEARETETVIARGAYRPEWMVEVNYGFRRASDPVSGASLPDLVTGLVSISVPLFTGNRQDRRLEAARRSRDAVRFDHADALRRLRGTFERQWALWQRHDELAEFYGEQLLPESELTHETTLSAYRSDRATFDELVRARVDDLDYRLRELRVGRRRDHARIELLYLARE